MNNKVLATTIVVMSSLISSAWAARPEGDPTCSFVGGAFYKSNNTLYLESINDENAKVEWQFQNYCRTQHGSCRQLDHHSAGRLPVRKRMH